MIMKLIGFKEEVASNFKLSIVVSVYKSNPFLQRFLDHLLQLEGIEDHEVLFVLNLPNFEEREIIDSFITTNANIDLRIICLNEVATVFRSWNIGISEAKFEQIVITNIDDLFCSNALKAYIEAFHKNPQVSLFYSGFMVVQDLECKISRKIKPRKFNRDSFKQEMRISPFFAIRKDLWRELGYFDESFRIAGDFDFAIRMAETASALGIEDYLGYVLSRPDSLSSIRNEVHVRRHMMERLAIRLRYNSWSSERFENDLAREMERIGDYLFLQDVKVFKISPAKFFILRRLHGVWIIWRKEQIKRKLMKVLKQYIFKKR
jgi:hypothetical protein